MEQLTGDRQEDGAVRPASGCGCSAAGGAKEPFSYIYALGRAGWRFPSKSVEKEFAQVIGRMDNAGKTDIEAQHAALSERRNRYLLRQLCWVFSIEGLEAYLLVPRDIGDLDLLLDAVRPAPTQMDLDIVVGTRGPMAPPGLCNGLSLPIITVDQLYSFDRDALFVALPRVSNVDEQLFMRTASEVFDRIMQLADNAGATDEHRAVNYLAVRYSQLYHKTIEAHQNNLALTSVETRSSRLNGSRRIVDVILTYTHRTTDVAERSFVRVDVTEQFPFLVTKISPYFDR